MSDDEEIVAIGDAEAMGDAGQIRIKIWHNGTFQWNERVNAETLTFDSPIDIWKTRIFELFDAAVPNLANPLPRDDMLLYAVKATNRQRLSNNPNIQSLRDAQHFSELMTESVYLLLSTPEGLQEMPPALPVEEPLEPLNVTAKVIL